jgi:hypothetical protein
VALMGSVILYCRNAGCGASYGSKGSLPIYCPTCGKPTKWSTSPPHSLEPPAWNPSDTDCQMLRAFKIDPT